MLGRGRPVTTVMITNSVEEAILLSDRIVPMTRGPPRHARRADPRRAAAAAHGERAVHDDMPPQCGRTWSRR